MTKTLKRREFVLKAARGTASAFLLSLWGPVPLLAKVRDGGYDPRGHYYGMGIQVHKCIGCGKCVQACKVENDVPQVPFYYQTWVERYIIDSNLEATVDSPDGGIRSFPPPGEERDILRSFFVPKLCNHCDNPPCVQVCPVGATFKTEDGVILVDKCTFCYHRITRGLLPACVEVCPTQARVFGELRARTSPLRRMMRMTELQVLKPSLNTEPKVLYSRLDREVR